jgi:predicted nucleotidyltransferase
VTNLSLDWSDRAVLAPLARLLAAVHHETRATPLLLVGAAARDLLLVHAHGVALERVTEDTDLALAVPNWDEFLRLRTALIASGGFTPDGPQHRLWFEGRSLDLIPIGGVERADRSVAWPPDGAQVMSVPGFTEAMATAVTIRCPVGSLSQSRRCRP